MNKTIYVADPVLWRRVMSKCDRQGVSMSSLIAHLLRVWLDAQN